MLGHAMKAARCVSLSDVSLACSSLAVGWGEVVEVDFIAEC